jgi:hypothetical protein
MQHPGAWVVGDHVRGIHLRRVERDDIDRPLIEHDGVGVLRASWSCPYKRRFETRRSICPAWFYGWAGNPGASMRLIPAGFLMLWAAIHSSACRCSARPSASCCTTPIRRRVTAAYKLHVGILEPLDGVVEVCGGALGPALHVRE